MILTFEIPGDPRGKGRPRFARRGGPNGFIGTYTDDKTAAYENLVALAARDALAGRPAYAGPVAIALQAVLRIPKTTSKAMRAAMLAGTERPAKLPDLDNILKAVLDGCNQVAFHDDRQVVGIEATKLYGETPRVVITITPVGS